MDLTIWSTTVLLLNPQALKSKKGQISRAASRGFDALLAEHSECWARRWASAAIDIPENPLTAASFTICPVHLLSTSNEDLVDGKGGAAIGPRGLTGDAYSGHVFWETDVFVAPALAAMAPRSALAALQYRYHRLSEAKARAQSAGYKGARYPWESAATGYDVTPKVPLMVAPIVNNYS
jgi:trehalose/maltose hydrolase-like predicted phosphorylase